MGALTTGIGAPPAQVAPAWLLALGEDVVPVRGTKRVSRLEENVAAAAVEPSPDQLDRLTALTPPAGEHREERQMSMIER